MNEREALKLALEALEHCVETCFDKYSHEQVMSRPEHFVNQTITAIKEALAQPEQEPVAWGHPNSSITGRKQALMMVNLEIPSNAQYPELWVPLYTTPPQRTWVDLTDEDKQIAFDDTQEGGGFWEFADAIEAKLKEKNT